jgi:hypothetical protein
MKKILLLASLGISLTAFGADVIPNECAFPAAKPLINAAFTAQATSNTAVSASLAAQAASNAAYAALSGLSNATLTVLNGSGTTNTLIITNGTIRIVQ